MSELAARRVVSGRTPDGRSTVIADGPATHLETHQLEGSPFQVLHFWNDDQLSLDTTDRTDQSTLGDIFTLVPGATRFSIESMAPTAEPTGWHRTSTIDYEYIVSGTIDLQLEDGSSVTLTKGDVNIQLGGMHQWWNHYDEPCVFLLVMLGVESDLPPKFGL